MTLISVTRWLAVSIGFLVAGVCVIAAAQTPGQKPPSQKSQSLMIESVGGRDLFVFYCATCHGRSGRGDGPVASALLTKPADLTRIAARRGGEFPAKLVESAIVGDTSALTSHGTREMPVWGPIFRSLDPNEPMTKVRISNLVMYLESIQR